MPRTPGRIDRDGDTATATALVEALTAAQTDREIAESYTHPFHAYPARMHPATAQRLVELVGQGAPPSAPLVDPFCGSGTVLVEARSVGLRAIGVDLNPLAVLVARAKTWTATPARRAELSAVGHELARAVVAAGKAARRAGAQTLPLRGPPGFDPNARNRRLARWFAPHVRRELEDLAARLDQLRARDSELADVLAACMSAVLYKVSSRASDTDPSWVERHVARGAAARLFALRVDLLVAGLDDLARTRGTSPTVYEQDARRLGKVVADGSACAVVTSPPYAGTYDYAEHQRLRFDFLGLRHRDLDAGELASRRAFEHDPHAAERAWHDGLADALTAIARALPPGRRAALVVGDSVALGRALFALDVLRDVLPGDLAIEAWASQHRPMLGKVERDAFGERPKAEHAVVLRRM